MAIINNNTARTTSNSSYNDRADWVSTAEMNALTPEKGRTVYDTDTNLLMVYNSTEWVEIGDLTIETYRGETGWALYENSNYTHLSPFSVTEGNSTQLDFNAADSVETHLPENVTSFLDPLTNTFTPVGLNSVYMFNLSIEASSTANNGIAFLEIKSGGATFREEVMNFAKGADTHQGFNLMSTQVVSQYVIDNGFQIWFRATTGNLELHGIRLSVTKLYHSI